MKKKKKRDILMPGLENDIEWTHFHPEHELVWFMCSGRRWVQSMSQYDLCFVLYNSRKKHLI